MAMGVAVVVAASHDTTLTLRSGGLEGDGRAVGGRVGVGPDGGDLRGGGVVGPLRSCQLQRRRRRRKGTSTGCGSSHGRDGKRTRKRRREQQGTHKKSLRLAGGNGLVADPNLGSGRVGVCPSQRPESHTRMT